jgi:hypothetical protein
MGSFFDLDGWLRDVTQRQDIFTVGFIGDEKLPFVGGGSL